MDYALISFRMLLVFTLVLIFFQFPAINVSLPQNDPVFDLISNFVLSSILGGYLFNANLSWIDFIYIVYDLFCYQRRDKLAGQNTVWGRGMVISTPTVIINNGCLLPENLQK